MKIYKSKSTIFMSKYNTYKTGKLERKKCYPIFDLKLFSVLILHLEPIVWLINILDKFSSLFTI